MLTCLADVVAPNWKLWVLNWDESICSSFIALSRALLKACLVNYLLLENRKSGPGVPPCLERYCTSACTGHTAWPVFPKYIHVPFLNWSLFDCFILTCISDGNARLSKATSDNVFYRIKEIRLWRGKFAYSEQTKVNQTASCPDYNVSEVAGGFWEYSIMIGKVISNLSLGW